jgi:MFS family permease
MPVERLRPATGNGWYVVGLCALAFVLSYTDRQVLSLLIEPIKRDLHISDTQFGLLQGLAFSLFYAVMGLPVSSLSDRRSRPLIIAAGVLVWSAATVLCGFARNYLQMLLARMMVGAGEATLSPATYALIADLFPPEKLGRATAVYSLGSFLGAGVAYLVGGAAIAALSKVGALQIFGVSLQPWQMVLCIVGAPGLLLAAVIVLTVREPRVRDRAQSSVAWREVFAFLSTERRIFLPHLLGYSCAAMALFGLLSWSPAYLMRTYGLSPQQAGLYLGVIAIFCNGGGVLLSGVVMDARRRAGHVDGPFRVGILGAIGVIPGAAMLAVAPTLAVALTGLALTMTCASFPMPPSAALIQLVAPPLMRARISAIFLFCNSLIGLAGGAALIGFLNDHAFGGPAGIRVSLPLTVALSAGVAVLLLALGLRPLTVFERSRRLV